MMARIPARTFMEWMAYDRIEPFGPERADARAAVMPWLFSSAFRGKNKSAPKLQDFMVNTKKKTAKQSGKEMQDAWGLNMAVMQAQASKKDRLK